MKITRKGYAILETDTVIGGLIENGQPFDHDGEGWLKDPHITIAATYGTVYDIGAFIGTSCSLWLKLNAKVLAFEAYPDAFECLNYNVGSRVVCVPLAVGDGSKAVFTNEQADGVLPYNPGGRRLVWDKNLAEGFTTAKIDDIRAFKPPTLVKIDVEGMEPLVLDGMINTLREYRPVLLIEINRPALKIQGFSESDIFKRLETWYDHHPTSGSASRMNTEEPWDCVFVPKGNRNEQQGTHST